MYEYIYIHPSILSGAGFIGSHVADALMARGDRVRNRIHLYINTCVFMCVYNHVYNYV
jgi:hypothetical protein